MSHPVNDTFNENAYERLEIALEELNEAIKILLDNQILARERLVQELKETIDILK